VVVDPPREARAITLFDTQAEAHAEIIRLHERWRTCLHCRRSRPGTIARWDRPWFVKNDGAGLPKPAIDVTRRTAETMSDTPRRLPSSLKGVASGRTEVRGGARLYNQLADDRDRARPAPSLPRLAWLERPDPDSVREISPVRLVIGSRPRSR
jgi:hypothetical protein